MEHRRGPSIDSATFAIPDLDTEQASDNESLSSYAGSGESVNEDEFSPQHYLQEALARAFDPSLLDRAVVIQAQTSGMVNAKSKEVQVLQKQAAERLAEVRSLFTSGAKQAKQVTRDLDYIQKRLSQLQKKAQIAYPIEYQTAHEQIAPQ